MRELAKGGVNRGPAPLANNALGDALHHLVTTYGQGDLAVNLTVEGSPVDVPAATQAALYRVAEEALTNAHRHATGASRVDVRLAFQPDAVDLEVTDDGQGGQPVEGFGLTGARERLTALGGHLHVGPASERGLRLSGRVPVAVLT